MLPPTTIVKLLFLTFRQFKKKNQIKKISKKKKWMRQRLKFILLFKAFQPKIIKQLKLS